MKRTTIDFMLEPAMTILESHEFSPQDTELLERFMRGDRRALARLITRFDNGEDPSPWLHAIESAGRVIKPNIIGVTGPPGAGKSTLIGALIPLVRKRDFSIAVIAVDPESPYTGGAILGDRIRMGRHVIQDEKVYIRSLSSRGSSGGLSRSARSICRLLGAFGFDLIILETVGAGQAELSVMDAADLVLLLLVPGTGDGIQWEKAGQMEIADVFALNKADLPGSEALEAALRAALENGYVHGPSQDGELIAISPKKTLWNGPPPVVKTVAADAIGIDELIDYLLEGLALVATKPDSWRSPVRRRIRAGLEEFFERKMRLLNLQHDFMESLTASVRLGNRPLEEAIQVAWNKLDGIH